MNGRNYMKKSNSFLKKQNLLLSHAIRIASVSHEGVLDKGGLPYILHPIAVMHNLHTDDPELNQIAVLHDVLEDDPKMSVEKLKSEGFSDRVIEALKLLTHDPDDDYEEYIQKISKNIDATRVKISDLKHNSQISRLTGLREKDFEKMKKYHKSYKFLKDKLANMK